MASEESKSLRKLREISETRKKDRRDYLRRRRWRSNEPSRASELLNDYFEQNPEIIRKIEEHRALSAWPTIVGAAAAKATWAKNIRGHKLIVVAPDPVWRQQLVMLRTQILDKYRSLFPRLKLGDIFFAAY